MATRREEKSRAWFLGENLLRELPRRRASVFSFQEVEDRLGRREE